MEILQYCDKRSGTGISGLLSWVPDWPCYSPTLFIPSRDLLSCPEDSWPGKFCFAEESLRVISLQIGTIERLNFGKYWTTEAAFDTQLLKRLEIATDRRDSAENSVGQFYEPGYSDNFWIALYQTLFYTRVFLSEADSIWPIKGLTTFCLQALAGKMPSLYAYDHDMVYLWKQTIHPELCIFGGQYSQRSGASIKPDIFWASYAQRAGWRSCDDGSRIQTSSHDS